MKWLPTKRTGSAMSSPADRMAEANRRRSEAGIAITEGDILAAMDPNGATMKLAEIIAQLSSDTGYSSYEITSNVQNKLRRMRKSGRVELTKGAGSGWRITSSNGAKP